MECIYPDKTYSLFIGESRAEERTLCMSHFSVQWRPSGRPAEPRDGYLSTSSKKDSISFHSNDVQLKNDSIFCFVCRED